MNRKEVLEKARKTYRQKLKDEGLIHVQVIVPKEYREFILEEARKLREEI